MSEKYYKTVTQIKGPLIVAEKMEEARFNELVEFTDAQGKRRRGQVLEVNEGKAIIQVFEGTRQLDRQVKLRLTGETMKLNASESMLGRVFNGVGDPLDGKEKIVSTEKRDINGLPVNPAKRLSPNQFIETGISAIDGLNTVTMGQKIAIFSGAGLPHHELVAQIVRQTRLGGKQAIVVGGIGLTHDELQFYLDEVQNTNSMQYSALFLSAGDAPTIEKVITPRIALTAAEYLAWEKGYNVLCVLVDMRSYAESLREISSAREEVPGRMGSPGYLYTDLAAIYERTGIVEGSKGSITQIPVLSMPNDDITHPIPDLSGYITEGQIVISRELYLKGVSTPIDVLPSLSRLMPDGIGKGKTREDHREWSNQLYSFYAQGVRVRELAAVVGEEALTDEEKQFLQFAKSFEEQFIAQKRTERRSILETFRIGWNLLSQFKKSQLTQIREEHLHQYYGVIEAGEPPK